MTRHSTQLGYTLPFMLDVHSKVWPEFTPMIGQKNGSRYTSENATMKTISDTD